MVHALCIAKSNFSHLIKSSFFAVSEALVTEFKNFVVEKMHRIKKGISVAARKANIILVLPM